MSDIIDLDEARKTTIREVRKDYSKPVCRHRSLQISATEYHLSCVDCGAAMDPYRVLLDYAGKERSLEWSQSAVEKARKAVDTLRAEEKRVKARLRRAREALRKIAGEA